MIIIVSMTDISRIWHLSALSHYHSLWFNDLNFWENVPISPITCSTFAITKSLSSFSISKRLLSSSTGRLVSILSASYQSCSFEFCYLSTANCSCSTSKRSCWAASRSLHCWSRNSVILSLESEAFKRRFRLFSRWPIPLRLSACSRIFYPLQ